MSADIVYTKTHTHTNEGNSSLISPAKKKHPTKHEQKNSIMRRMKNSKLKLIKIQ